jgi:peptide/nickel transport system permease protein
MSIWRNLPLKAKIGAVVFGVFLLIAIFGPIFQPYDPGFAPPDATLSLNHPSAKHLLGTTQLGQDVLSQVLTGIRLTIILALAVGAIATVLSVLVGVTSAFLGGIWDEVLSLVTNVFLVVPALPLLIVLLGYLSTEGQLSTIIVLAGLGWPWGARVIRAQTLTIRNRDFIAASRESGEKTWRIIVFDIIPNEISLIVANFVNTVLYAIGASVALAFAGIANLESFSLGTILYWAQDNNGTALVLLNSGIDEVGNPRLRASRGSTRIAGHRIWTTDPTPVLAQLTASRSRVGTFLHAFSRSSLLDETPAGGELR